MGVNTRLDPASLPAGVVADARNILFRNGIAETRKGVAKPGWLNNVQPAVAQHEINPWGEIHGVGVYRDPNSIEYVIIAADNKVYFTREGNTPVELALEDGCTITGSVHFTQAFNVLVMYRGRNFKPLEMSDIDDGFVDQISAWDSSATYGAGDKVAYGPFQTVTLARSGTTVTATLSGHGYVTGQDITISGAVETDYNVRAAITKVDADTFTYEVTTTPTTPATGTIKATTNFDYYQADASSVPAAGEAPLTYSAKWAQAGTVMPNAESGVSIANRIAVATTFDTTNFTLDNKKDYVVVSDILSTKATFFDQQLRINQGDAGELVDLLPFDSNRLICFKDTSVYMVTGFIVETTNATFASSISLETLIPSYGMSAPRAAVMIGSDVYFYSSKRGIVSMQQTTEGQTQSVDIPLSEPVQSIIDRVDPRHEDKVRLAAWDNMLWVALPLDDAANGECNALLKYDFLNKQWSGYDDGTAIRIKEFFTATVQKETRLFYWSGDGFVNLVGEHDHGDQVRDTDNASNLGTEEIASVLKTRGYSTPTPDFNWYSKAMLNIATWYPSFTIKLHMDGAVEEQTLVTDRTKSRTNYYRPFDAAPYDTENVNDDHGTPYREDYSVATIPSSFLLLEDGEALLLEDDSIMEQQTTQPAQTETNGIVPMRMQETQEPFTLNPRQGRYGQIEITNSQGRLALTSVVLESASGGKTLTIKS